MLPIDDVLADIVATLAHSTSCVLQAPPGAGKTTRVPLALLEAPWLAGRKIIMLEPRRLAARAAASYMSHLLNDDVGGVVGYRIRFDTRVGSRTRIEVVTEGVLTRMLQSDAALEEYGVVIFDEFHERSLHADLGLALTLQSRAMLREDLRIVVMSATLETAAVAQLLGNAPIIASSGRSFPVETQYLGRSAGIVRAVQTALYETDGDVLVFLPGQAEIHRALDALSSDVDNNTYVVPLYGNLTQPEQDRAIAPAPRGRRKVVLATSIAETSLTIEGVRAVVDSGLMRVPRFDARIGMTRLETINVTRASADQRRGRAGRVAPGVCYRLWSAHEDAGLVPHTRPEILEADLAPLALDLAAWGVRDPNELQWLDAPPASAFAQARELLRELGALADNCDITTHGKRMASLPLHPRLAHMLLRAKSLGAGALACDLAAQLNDGRKGEAAHYRRLLHVAANERADDASKTGLLLAFAYPDRIGEKREERGRFLLRNGRGAWLDKTHPNAGDDFIVAAELEGSGRDSRVFMAAAISEDEIREHFADQIERERVVAINDTGTVQVVVRERLGAIVLKERGAAAEPGEIEAALLEDVRKRGVDALAWRESARELRNRIAFLRNTLGNEWPDVSAGALELNLEEWLLPGLHGARRRSDVDNIDLHEALLRLLPWQLRAQLDRLAPTHLEVPSGSHSRIDYSDANAPFVAVRLQEVFGMHETPRLAGRVPLTMHLLSPARRPVQVTRDLASFWKSGYFEVKKELKGRYPKHYWPDDPMVAEATRIRRKNTN